MSVRRNVQVIETSKMLINLYVEGVPDAVSKPGQWKVASESGK